MLIKTAYHYRRNLSLKSRLFLAATLWLSTMIVAAGIGIPLLVKDYLVSDIQAQLQLSLDEIAANVSVDHNKHLIMHSPLSDHRFNQPYSGLYWLIQSDRQTLRSRSLWDKTITHHTQGHRSIQQGARGETLIVLTQSLYLPTLSSSVQVTVGVDEAPVRVTIQHITKQLWFILALLFSGILFFIGLQVSWSLRPLNKMQKELLDLKAGHKEALEAHYPKEVSPLVEDLNALLFHYQELLARARRHAGNLSHALKTPLSVLRNDIRNLPPEQQVELLTTIEQIQSQIDYHLSQARIAGSMNILAAKASPSVRIDWISQAFDKVYAHRRIMVINELDSELMVAVEESDLDEMLGNLLENSYKWANSLVRVYTEAAEQKHTVRLCIEDDGPGIAEHERAQALERGVRLDEQTSGTGLGLHIVNEMVHSYRGKLTLESSSTLGGLKAVLTLKCAS